MVAVVSSAVPTCPDAVCVALRVDRTGRPGDAVTLADVERAIWTATGWTWAQRTVDDLVDVVRAYGEGLLAGGGVTLVEAARRVEPVTTVALDLGPGYAEPPAVATPADEVLVDNLGRTEVTCTGCHQALPVAAFGRDRTTRSGWKARCKECVARARKARQVAR